MGLRKTADGSTVFDDFQLWGSLGSLLGPSWAILGAAWSLLEPLWDSLAAVLCHLGRLLVLLGGFFKSIWAQLGLSLGPLGGLVSSWRLLVARGACLEP